MSGEEEKWIFLPFFLLPDSLVNLWSSTLTCLYLYPHENRNRPPASGIYHNYELRHYHKYDKYPANYFIVTLVNAWTSTCWEGKLLFLSRKSCKMPPVCSNKRQKRFFPLLKPLVNRALDLWPILHVLYLPPCSYLRSICRTTPVAWFWFFRFSSANCNFHIIMTVLDLFWAIVIRIYGLWGC